MRRTARGLFLLALAAPLAACLPNDAPFQAYDTPDRTPPRTAAQASPAPPSAAKPTARAEVPARPPRPAAPATVASPAPARRVAVAAQPPASPAPAPVVTYSIPHAAPPDAAIAPPSAATAAPAAPVASATSPADTCGAADLRYLIGKSRMEIPVPVDVSRRRVVCQGCPVTEDMRPDRQTITYDLGTGKVTKVQCG